MDAPYFVPEAFNRSGPVFRRRASLHAYKAGRKIVEKTHDTGPAQGAAEYRLAFGVHAVHRETVLCQINADGGNGRLGFAIFYATRFMRAGPSHHYALLRKTWASFQLDRER